MSSSAAARLVASSSRIWTAMPGAIPTRRASSSKSGRFRNPFALKLSVSKSSANIARAVLVSFGR